MTIPVSTLAQVSALASAVPHLTVTFDTDGGSSVIIGDFPEASMCAHAFRQVVAHWPEDGEHLPCVQDFFDGAQPRGPFLAQENIRWFATELSAQRTVTALRAAKPKSRGAAVQVRFDSALGISVVRIESLRLSSDELDDLATDAYAACMTEHLLVEAAAA